jgi:hypothetical protein
MNFEKWRKANENNIPFKPESESEFIDWLERAFNEAQPQWQPIKTAPLDKDVIVFIDGYIGKARFNKMLKCWCADSFGVDDNALDMPSYWQPLPQQPSGD